jgi:hypothetical protein
MHLFALSESCMKSFCPFTHLLGVEWDVRSAACQEYSINLLNLNIAFTENALMGLKRWRKASADRF